MYSVEIMAYRFCYNNTAFFLVKCKPQTDPKADCGIYEGIIQVYGSSARILPQIQNYLNAQDPQSVHPNLIRIFAEHNSDESIDLGTVDGKVFPGPPDMNKTVNATTTSQSNHNERPNGIIWGIVVSVISLGIGIAGLIYFQGKRRVQENESLIGTPLYAEHGSTILSWDASYPNNLVVEDGRPTLVESGYYQKSLGRPSERSPRLNGEFT
jgi:hypothetical protein